MGASRAQAPQARVALLGPLTVTVGEESVALGGPRQRAVLALLALEVGKALQPAHLISMLWDDDPPQAAANTIQVYVSRLRRALAAGDAPSPLVTVGGSYRLDLPPDAVDAVLFPTLATRGHAQLAAGDAAAAADTLRRGLALWRGAPLPDLADLAGAHGVVARLASLRMAALADRIDADAALGRHTMLVPELEGLVRLHPLDERLVGQLMNALYATGRQADALAAYSAAAERLADELGVDPGPYLRDLYQLILRQELDVAPPTTDRAAAPVLPGGGQPAADGDVSQPDGAAGEPDGGLIGRRDELAAVLDLLTRPEVRLVTVLGPGGAGKTRLAREVAERIGAPMVLLAALDDVDDVLPEVCRVLGAEPDWTGEPPLDVATRALSGTDAVLVLDNLEQLRGVEDVISALLERVSALRLVVTTRIVLGMPGEQVLPLGPLPTPPAGTSVAEKALQHDSVRLFRGRARRALPSFEVTDENALAVSDLCRALEGLPLALELAAARVAMVPPAEIVHRLERLDARQEVLSGGPSQLPQRHRSMWAAIDWSVRLLEPHELRVFAQLSVFGDGWTIAAAETVCATESFGEINASEPVLDVLNRLHDRSLLVADGSGRMSMLDTIRDYAVQLLAGAPERRHATRMRHARFYTQLAEELGPLAQPWRAGDGQERRALTAENANFGTALEFSAASGDGAELLGRLVTSLVDHWYGSSRVALADRWVSVARSSPLPGHARVRLLLSLGNLAVARAEVLEAVLVLADARDQAAVLEEPALVVRSLAALATATRYAGDPAAALALLAEARRQAEPLGIAGLDRALATEEAELLDEVAKTAEAVARWEQVLADAAKEEDLVHQAFALIDLARVAAEQGDLATAEAHAGEARALAGEAGQQPVLSDVLAVCGLVDLLAGHPTAAAGYLGGALRLAIGCGQLLAVPELTGLLGAARAAEGDQVVGARLLGASAQWRDSRGVVPGSRVVRAVIARAEAELAAAADRDRGLVLEQARGARTRFGSLRGLAAADPGLLAPADITDTGVPVQLGGRAVIDLRPAPVALDETF